MHSYGVTTGAAADLGILWCIIVSWNANSCDRPVYLGHSLGMVGGMAHAPHIKACVNRNWDHAFPHNSGSLFALLVVACSD